MKGKPISQYVLVGRSFPAKAPREPGTTVWWTDDQGNKRSATVEESFNQINEIMEKLLKDGIDGLENSCQPDTQQ